MGTFRSIGSAALLLSCAVTACGGGTKQEASGEPAAAQSEPGAAPRPEAKPAPSAPSPTAAAPSGQASAGGLQWRDVPPFVRRAAKSSMRAAEYGIEGNDQAELAVFYFGPDQGGTVEANEKRWLGQFTQPDGSDSESKAKRSKRSVGGVEVSLIEVAGNYSGGMAMPGAAAPPPIQDAMMLAAIASGPQGPVFFKLVGPRAAVEQAREGFDQMIGSLR
jgi:hypothetical protein